MPFGKGVDFLLQCNYSGYIMKVLELTVTRVGNSRGVRLPAEVLRRYHIGSTVLMEQRADEIALRPKSQRNQNLTWEETAKAMAAAKEDWSDWECTAADGLNEL